MEESIKCDNLKNCTTFVETGSVKDIKTHHHNGRSETWIRHHIQQLNTSKTTHHQFDNYVIQKKSSTATKHIFNFVSWDCYYCNCTLISANDYKFLVWRIVKNTCPEYVVSAGPCYILESNINNWCFKRTLW